MSEAAVTADQRPWFIQLLGASGWGSCRIALAWATSGGVAAGGALVAAVTLSGGMSSGTAPSVSLILFLMGASAGLVHGSLFGYIARDLQRTPREALRGILAAVVLAIPSLVVAWIAALWISLSAAALRPAATFGTRVGVGIGWLIGLALFAWAAYEGVHALIRAFKRWPEYRVAAPVLSVIFAVLAVRFLSTRPEIWGTEIRVTGVGALVLALGATVWIALPVAIAVLYAVRKLLGGGRASS